MAGKPLKRDEIDQAASGSRKRRRGSRRLRW